MGFGFLDLTADHSAALERLPDMHGDPFDRLLLAQALYEPARLLSADALICRAHDTVIPA
jgi:PIN domain nuclease of toxin-antitoxin system